MTVNFPIRRFKITPLYDYRVFSLYELAEAPFLNEQDLENITALNVQGSIEISEYTITRIE